MNLSSATYTSIWNAWCIGGQDFQFLPLHIQPSLCHLTWWFHVGYSDHVGCMNSNLAHYFLKLHPTIYVAGGIQRVRVHSISLWCIHDIYVRWGIQTWQVNWIGISYCSAPSEGSSRFTIKIEGLRLEIGGTGFVSSKPASVQKDKRRLTLADLSLSPLVFYLWLIVARIYVFVEPYLWPVIHSVTVACIHIFIQCLPALTQMFHFDLESMPSLT